jgi:hypothetical protein
MSGRNWGGTRRPWNWGAPAGDGSAQYSWGQQRGRRAGVCERTVEHVIRESARMVVATHLPTIRVETQAGSWALGDRLRRGVAGRPSHDWCRDLARDAPVAIGAPGSVLPEVARGLNASLSIPPHARSATPWAAGVVSQSIEIRSTSLHSGSFACTIRRVPRFPSGRAAIGHARKISVQLRPAARAPAWRTRT